MRLKNIKPKIRQNCRHSLFGSVDWNFFSFASTIQGLSSLPFWECGLKYICLSNNVNVQSHSLFGSVDWNKMDMPILGIEIGHSLFGSVDWNKERSRQFFGENVTPFLGVWIEIMGIKRMKSGSRLSLPFWECGLKFKPPFGMSLQYRHSLFGSVDWNVMVSLAGNIVT